MDYADKQILMRCIAQLLKISKASEEGSIQSFCSPAACGPNFRTKEAPRPQMAREAAGLSRAEPS